MSRKYEVEIIVKDKSGLTEAHNWKFDWDENAKVRFKNPTLLGIRIIKFIERKK